MNFNPEVTGAADPSGEESRDELKRRVDAQRLYAATMKEDHERTQRRLLAAETRVKELQTQLLACEAECDSLRETTSNAAAPAECRVQVAESRAAVAVDRLKLGPQIDRGVRMHYVELLGMMCRKSGAPLPKLNVGEESPLVLLERLRGHMRAFFNAEAEASAIDAPRHAPVLFVSPPSASALATVDPPRRSALVVHHAPTEVAQPHQNAIASDEVGALRAEVKKLRAQEDYVREHSERVTDIARRDCTAAKLENRELSRTVKDLELKLKLRGPGETKIETDRRRIRELRGRPSRSAATSSPPLPRSSSRSTLPSASTTRRCGPS